MSQRFEDADVKLEQELRRGVLVLAALSQLREPQYGYSLRQALAAKGMLIEEGTLYPLLRRLEGQGILVSEWRIENGPPRRYYSLSEEGRLLFTRLAASWRGISATVGDLIGETELDQRRAKASYRNAGFRKNDAAKQRTKPSDAIRISHPKV